MSLPQTPRYFRLMQQYSYQPNSCLNLDETVSALGWGIVCGRPPRTSTCTSQPCITVSLKGILNIVTELKSSRQGKQPLKSWNRCVPPNSFPPLNRSLLTCILCLPHYRLFSRIARSLRTHRLQVNAIRPSIFFSLRVSAYASQNYGESPPC